MKLIADSGSTKCDWIGINDEKEIQCKVRSRGMNPVVLNEDELLLRLTENETLTQIKEQVTELYFFGAGCSDTKQQELVQTVLQDFFTQATYIQVLEDLDAAVYACTSNQPGIVSILGTGSNCCFYDGKKIHTRIPSLGYTLMDDASGNSLGKMILRAYFFNQMPASLRTQFENHFEVDIDEIREHLYKQPNANTYLAAYAKFLFEHLDEPFVQQLLTKAIEGFIDTHMQLYKEEASKYPLHFVGSIAYFAQEQIKQVLAKHQMQAGKFIRRPVEALIHIPLRIQK